MKYRKQISTFLLVIFIASSLGLYATPISAASTINLTINTTGDKTIDLKRESNTFTLSGMVSDSGNNTVTVSATIDGVLKVAVIPNPQTPKEWKLSWQTSEFRLGGSFSNIMVTANNGKDSTSTSYNGKVIVNKSPLYYWDKYSLKDVPISFTQHSTFRHKSREDNIFGYGQYDFDYYTGRYSPLGYPDTVPSYGTWVGTVVYTFPDWTGRFMLKYVVLNEGGYDVYEMTAIPYQTNKQKDAIVASNILDVNGTYPDNGIHSDGFWYEKKELNNQLPDLSVNSENKVINGSTKEDLIIMGTVKDGGSDTVQILASIGGVTKSTSVDASSSSKTWSLRWPVGELPDGSYTNFAVIADDGKGGITSSLFNNTVLIDKSGPTAPSISLSHDGWTNQNVTVSVTPGIDSTSGISKTEYSLDEDVWHTYTAPFIISKEGATKIKARSTDGAGNVGGEAVSEARIVKSPPTKPSIQLRSDSATSLVMYTGPVNFTITGSSGYGGFDYEYKIDDGTFQQGDGGEVTKEGVHRLTARAVNTFGQKSPEAEVTFTIDQTGPVIELMPNGRDWAPDKIKAQVNVSDALSGVKPNSVFYKVTASSAVPGDWEILNDPEIEISTEGQWYVHVKAMDNAGNASTFTSNVMKLQHNPVAPANVKANNIQNDQVTITWDLPEGYTDGYEYEVTNTVTGATYQIRYPENSITDRGVTGGREYEYIVKVKNHVGEDTAAGITVLTKPDAPETLQIKKIERDFSRAMLEFSKVMGANSYHVVVRDSAGNVIFDKEIQGETCTITGLQPGTINSVTVAGINTAGEGPASNISFLSLPDTPDGFTDIKIEEDAIEMQWNTVTTAVYFNLERYTNLLERHTNLIYEGLETQFRDVGLLPGTVYDYRLFAVNETGAGDYAYLNDLLTLPAKPTGLKTTATENSMTVQWDTVQGAEAYLLESSLGVTESVYGTQYTFDGLLPGTEYEYTITPKNRSGYGKSSTISGHTLPDQPTGIQVTNIEETSADITWDAVPGADKYLVQIGGMEYEVSSPNLSISGLSGSQLYDFTVWAGNSSGYGAAAAADLMTKPHAPSNLTVKALSTDSISLGWDADSTATRYRAMISGSGDEKELQDHKSIFKGLDPGTGYQIEVWTENGSGVSVPAKIAVTTKTLPVNPDGITIEVEHDQVIIDFKPVEHAKDHVLLDENGTEIWRGTEGPITITPVTPGKEYEYSLVAENEQKVPSEPSKVSFIAIPGSPEGIKITEVRETSITFDLSQADKTGAEFILVYRDGKEIGKVKAAAKTYTDKNLKPDTKYSYEFKAINESGTSKKGVKIEAVTKKETAPEGGSGNNSGDTNSPETGIAPKPGTDNKNESNVEDQKEIPDKNPSTGADNNSTFDDIERSFAKNEIIDLAGRGVVKGTNANKFEPERPITRMEFVSMIVRALEIENVNNKPFMFEDINLSKWYAPEFKAAWDNEVAHGFSAKEFRPNALINREQASKMLGNVLQARSEENSNPFIDSANIAVWARSEVIGLTEKNLVTGYPDGSFRPKANLTRAESAALIYRTLSNN